MDDTSRTLDNIEAVARNIITEAGDIVREHMGKLSASSIHAKGPSDYVTEIDKRCEELILKAVREGFPDHHIMSEETANDGLQPGFTWVVDPVDGTTNFIHGFPFVAVSIAVCLEKKPVLGFVIDPVRNELFTARAGRGAWLNGARIAVRKDAELPEALVATGFPFRTKDYMDNYLKAFKSVFLNVSGIRRAGAAALDLAYLAAGRVDGFWEIGLKAWDIAAGALLIREAGGVISDFWGEDRLLYNGHVVGGTPSVYPFLLAQVQEFLVPALESGR